MPHAERGVRSFMLTCLAEGRSADDDDENDKSKGPAVVCELGLDDVHAAVALTEQGACGEDESYVSKLVMDTARRAVDLMKLSAAPNPGSTALACAIWAKHIEVPTPVTKEA